MHRAHLLVKQTFFFSITFKINYCQKQKCIILKNKKKKKKLIFAASSLLNNYNS